MNSEVSGKTKFAGVIGWPVSHSLSPAIHNYWFEQYGIDAVYVPFPTRPEALSTAIPALLETGCIGTNLTLPHKELVLPMLADVDPIARAIGAVNTVSFADGAAKGYNTDAYGFWKNIEERAPKVQKKIAFVVGAGGAARAVVAALDQAGFEAIFVMNRTRDKVNSLYSVSRKVRPVEWFPAAEELEVADLVVNTSSLGMVTQPPLELALGKLPPHAVVADIVYTPLETPLQAAARRLGLTTVDGLGMLLYQAQKAFEIWFGILPEVSADLRMKVLEAKA